MTRELSVEQKQRAKKLENSWLEQMLDKGREKDFNLGKIVQYGRELYKSCPGPDGKPLELPAVIITSSPLSAQVVANLSPLLMLGQHVEQVAGVDLDLCFDLLDTNIGNSKYPGYVDFPTRARAHKAVKGAWRQLKEQYKSWPEEEPPAIMRIMIEDLIAEWPTAKAIKEQVSSGKNKDGSMTQASKDRIFELFSLLAGEAFDKFPNFYYPFSFGSFAGLNDIEWMSEYCIKRDDGLTQGVDDSTFDIMLKLVREGVYDGIQIRGLYIISTMPQVLSISREQGEPRLSALYGPAALWEDDKQGYIFIDGIYFEPELGEKVQNKTLSPRELIKLENAEQKKVAIKIYGIETLLRSLGAQVLDRQELIINGKPESYELISVQLEDEHDGIPAKYVKVVCHTTGGVYYLRVNPRDPRIKDCFDAIASTDRFAWEQGIGGKEYILLMEIET